MSYQKNDVLTVKIEDMGHDGEGIGKCEGYTLFVKDTVIGDLAEVKVIKAKKNYGYARLMRLIEPSPHRVEPICPVARPCGGCQLQMLDYAEQLRFKEKKIAQNLQRIGGMTEIPMEPIVGMESPFRYRNKAQFPIGQDKNGKLITGFYAGRTHQIMENRNCYLGVEQNEEILNRILAWMEENSVSAYQEETGKGLVRHVLIRFGFTTKEIMVCLVVNGKKLPAEKKLIQSLTELEGMTSITLSVNRERTNVIMGKEIRCLWGQEFITDYIGKVKYQISPLSFYQVNPVQTEKLYSLALEYAGLTGEETVWDLYCGIGTISLFLAQKAKKVYGVEIVPEAIADAKNNAKINGIENAEFFVGKSEEVLPEYYEKYAKEHPGEHAHADVIVVDPPRKGCEENLLRTMADMQPDRIVYVSCDSATLARDLKILQELGYEVKKVRGVDQFPMTCHVETVVLLSQLKQKPDDYINVTIELDDMDITSAETKATYDETKKYVAEHNAGMKVSNLYISQVKRKCGIEVGKNLRVATRRMDCLQGNSTTAATDLELVPSPNLPKNEDSRQPQCPEDKESAIVEALKHFKMNS